jgi:Leucine-rich repeat (LRR) protein
MFIIKKIGVLTEVQIVKNLLNFGATADGTKFTYLNLLLPGSNLNDIHALCKYKDLQQLDLSYNRITDLSVLSELPYLLYLNVSNNEIEKLFDFLPPYNLKEAIFSFNKIKEIGSLSNYHYLQVLELNSKQA